MGAFRVPSRRDWGRAFFWIAAYLVAMVVAYIVYWPVGFVVAIGGALALVAWHRKATAYRCLHCGHEFTISFMTDLISPHGIGRADDRTVRGWKYLRCPQCGQRSRATALIVTDD